MTVPVNDPKYWRERAEKTRNHAKQMSDPEPRKAMLKVAEDYEKLAKRAETAATGGAPATFYGLAIRLADNRLRLDPFASRCFGLKRTGERMLGDNFDAFLRRRFPLTKVVIRGVLKSF